MAYKDLSSQKVDKLSKEAQSGRILNLIKGLDGIAKEEVMIVKWWVKKFGVKLENGPNSVIMGSLWKVITGIMAELAGQNLNLHMGIGHNSGDLCPLKAGWPVRSLKTLGHIKKKKVGEYDTDECREHSPESPNVLPHLPRCREWLSLEKLKPELKGVLECHCSARFG